MKIIWMHSFISVCVCTFLILASCGKENQWAKESDILIKSSKDLTDRHRQLDARVDSLWDATTTILEQQLPLDFPSIDREIFLKARNADHMTMFKSFELLDSHTKSVIVQAGQYDQMIAQQMQDLMEEKSQWEKRKNQFLSEVAESNLALSHQFAGQFRSASNSSLH